MLLVFDEAQHLSIECPETLRELLDQPPHCGLLFAGTHELEQIFTRQVTSVAQKRTPSVLFLVPLENDALARFSGRCKHVESRVVAQFEISN